MYVIHKITPENLPPELLQAHLYLMKMTDEGKDWSSLETNAGLKRVAELAFQKLGEFMAMQGSLDGKPKDSPAVRQAKSDAMMYVFMELDQLQRIYELEKMAEQEYGLLPEIKIRKAALEKQIRLRKRDLKGNGISGKKYDPSVEIRFIKWFLFFHKRISNRGELANFIADLQEAIREKEIRKTSPYAAQITRIQKTIVDLHNTKKQNHKIKINAEFKEELEKIIQDHEKQQKSDEDDDMIKPVDLSGHADPSSTEGKIMSSIEFSKQEFKTLGFTDKWLELIGDPSTAFTAMVFGKPKMGKSFLCIDFAGYLARNFGKVLYVAKEEKLDLTLQQKLKEKDVAHENLFVSDHLPEDLSAYDFIFLDSVNLLGLNPAALRTLREKNPGKSFVYIFQTTKLGNFRGANSFQHDVDIVIEIPKKGKAVQFGRFNQGGEMVFFEEGSIVVS